MRLISNRALRVFTGKHPEAAASLAGWRKVVEAGRFESFAALRAAFNSVDRVGHYYVFNIGGNRYRLVAAIHFNTQILFVRALMTHAGYERWRP